MGRKKSEVEEIEVFLEDIRINPVNGCHEWQGGLATNGYGVYQAGGKSVLVHKYAWQLVNGEVPEGKVLRHTCDNKKCVLALDSFGGFQGHVILGTQQENMDDKIARNRLNKNPRKSVRVNSAEQETMARLFGEGATFYRIGIILNRSQQVVKQHVERFLGIGTAVA
jgi:hypothetical protein